MDRAQVMDLSGKVALVTGATRNVGRGVAHALSQMGAKVYITSRRQHEEKRPPGAKGNTFWGSLDLTVREGRELGATSLVPVVCDHRDDAQTEALFARMARDDDRLDIVVHAAWGGCERLRGGYPEDGPFDWRADFWEQPLSLWDEMQVVGVRSNYIVSALAARIMVKQRSGLIVNISFRCGQQYGANVAYSVSHAAMDRMAHHMAIDLQPYDVASVSLYPMGNVEEVKFHKPGDGAESGEFVGRAVAALYTDSALMGKTGKAFGTRTLAPIYGFTDTDGSLPKIPDDYAGWVRPDGSLVCPNPNAPLDE